MANNESPAARKALARKNLRTSLEIATADKSPASIPGLAQKAVRALGNLTTPFRAEVMADQKKQAVLSAAGLAVLLLAVRWLRRRSRSVKRAPVDEASIPPTIVLCVPDLEVHCNALGASILSIFVPDRRGHMDDIVLGHGSLADYQADPTNAYFGCIVGRVANRIENASFRLRDQNGQLGRVHKLEPNDGKHALHGGSNHWGRRLWQAEKLPRASGSAVRFTLTSPEWEAGYPGEVNASVTYIVSSGPGGSKLTVEMEATCTKATPINLVQHTYWNLLGHSAVAKGCTIEGHRVRIHSGCVTAVRHDLIPTGAFLATRGTAADFSALRRVGDAMQAHGGGFDTNFVLHPSGDDVRALANLPGGMLHETPQPTVELVEPQSGRALHIESNAPGVQMYTGNFLDGEKGKHGVKYGVHQGICFETQTFPNGVKQANFPSPVLYPGQVYRHTIVYSFSTVK